MSERKFNLGQIVVTKAVNDRMKESDMFKYFVYRSLGRHAACDWGELCEEDKETNDKSVENGGRLFSSYIYGSDKEKIWIITEWDRSVTTILFPEDY